MHKEVKIPRKIYYIKTTGRFVADTGEQTGVGLRQSTKEEDYEIYAPLKEFNKEAIGCLELEIGQYSEDFLRCTSFVVNTDSLEIEFAYPEDTKDNGELLYRKPLTEQVVESEARIKATEDMILALMGGL